MANCNGSPPWYSHLAKRSKRMVFFPLGLQGGEPPCSQLWSVSMRQSCGPVMARSWLQMEKKSRNLTCMLPLFAWTWYSHYAWLKRNKSSYGLAQKKSRAAGIFFPRQQAQWNFAALLAPLGPQNFGLLGPPGPHIIGLSTLARPWTVVGVVGHHLPLLPVSAVLPWRRRRIWVLCRCWRLALGLGSNLAWPSHWQPASCQLACGAPSWRSRQLQAS